MFTRPRFPVALAMIGALLVADAVVPAGFGILGSPAHAIVGRPATPVSYAGVARRTTRRTVAAVSVATPAPATVVVVAPPPAPAAQPVPPPK